MQSYLNNINEFKKVGYVLVQECSKEDYELLEEIAGREVCSDELCELCPIFSDTEDLKERWELQW